MKPVDSQSKASKVGSAQSLHISFCLGQDWGFPGGSGGKEYTCNAGDLNLIPGLERSSGEGNGNPLQYSGLENSSSWGRKESDTTERLFTYLVKHGIGVGSTKPEGSCPVHPE